MSGSKQQSKPGLSASSHRGADALTWPIGAAFVAVLSATFVVGVWWMARGAADAHREAEVRRIESLADNLSITIEPLLASEELSAVRRVLSETALANGFDVCQISLLNGEALADADLNQPQMSVIPAAWPGSAPSEANTRVTGKRLTLVRPIPVVGKGAAELVIEMPIASASVWNSQSLPGAALIGAVGLGALLLTYRRVRGRLMALSLIRGSLWDAAGGDLSAQSLQVDPRWGKEASGWNRLLRQRQAQEEDSLNEQLDALSERVGVGGPLESGCGALWLGLVLFDTQGRTVYANGAAAAMLTIPKDEMVSQAVEDLALDGRVVEAIRLSLRGSGPARNSIECDADRDQSECVLRMTIRPLATPAGLGTSGTGHGSSGAMLVIEDVTQMRVAEAGRHDFVAQATHELRAPLTNIRLYLDTAQDEGEDDPKIRGEALNVIGRESQRLERLVGDMLSVSEIEAGSIALKSNDVRLDELFGNLESDFGAKARDSEIDLVFDLPPKLPVIHGDREKLSIVVQNILGNALKYTPKGGDVRVNVDVTSSQLTLEVIDSGIGISEEDLPHVFEKFYRANDTRLGEITGSGLGLALAREIALLHGGDLVVESELNEGSTFKLILPIVVEGV